MDAQVVPHSPCGPVFASDVEFPTRRHRKIWLPRPKTGPLELKSITGKMPVLDVGTVAKIKSGNIKVYPGIKRITSLGAEFVDGRKERFDAIILATGGRYVFGERRDAKGAIPKWMEKGEDGQYAVGFTRRGLLGASFDAKRVAEDIELPWTAEAPNLMDFSTSLSL
ncbi:hypothetical protein V6N13_107254 [Hibiscus sabdariffa]